MDFEALRSEYGNFYTPRFAATVDGVSFTESDGVISDLTISATLNRADHFSFTLNYPFDHASGKFSGPNWKRFRLGKRVELSIGYESPLEPVFVGTINSMGPNFPSGGGPIVTVSGYGLLHEMMKGTKSRSWDEPTDSAVARAVADEYGFKQKEIEESDLDHRLVKQDKESDYQFLSRLAKKNGFEFAVRRGAFYFGPPRTDGTPVVTLRYGESLRSFSLDVSDSRRIGTVEVRHWDPTKKKEIVGSAECDDRGTGKKVIRRPVWSKEEANRIAEAECGEIADDGAQGNGETIGIPAIWAGETIQLEGLGEFSGLYYVNDTTHRTGSSGYTTTFQVTTGESTG